ncbi:MULTISPECIES: LacI family DNA-binding transcriptional regulator [Marinomonas]|uniref:LacI family DNA-binding transcriptional regulator n=1 Tax=Marinomonas arctica TaxID=383750 RepID=A0A7H1JAM2_9GAMM|nr:MULTISPECIES: LacI family DNA-binding transcriptional regulator [Marinomonas]MCS7487684.1 LacI family transcriptional regulator [Marinomonas sp. BSi20414]QNT07538.1 LacI family DNA-binding transcriptional regulator [Marinomonas arctica]GGN20614.1 transcriptional regulator [Marinomonas arctica]
MSTIYDVAKIANVSPKTVSRVLNNDAPVGEATRLKVQAAIDQLGYVPSTAARAMRSNKSGLIGVITGAISHNPISGPTGLPDLFILQGIQTVIQASSKTLLIGDTGDDIKLVAHLIRTFQEHRVEGIIYVADCHQQVSLPVQNKNIAIVLANCFDDQQTPAVIPDDEWGQYNLVKQILSAGHRRIAYLSLDKTILATELRTQGYRNALKNAGIDIDDTLIICVDTLDQEVSKVLLEQAVDYLLGLDQPPTAICCGNDIMALKIYRMLRSRGVRIPEDISVAGYDNYLAITESLSPSLTTVDLAYREIGMEAAKLLLKQIDTKQYHSSTTPSYVASPVVWRHSVQPQSS